MQSFSRTWIKNPNKCFRLFLKINSVTILTFNPWMLLLWVLVYLLGSQTAVRIWPLGFVFHFVIYRASSTMTIRVKVMAWNDNQRLYFISFQNTCVNIFYLPSTYLGFGKWGSVFKSQCQWAGYDWVLETTSGIADLNKKLLKTDYQSNGFNMAVENESH